MMISQVEREEAEPHERRTEPNVNEGMCVKVP